MPTPLPQQNQLSSQALGLPSKEAGAGFPGFHTFSSCRKNSSTAFDTNKVQVHLFMEQSLWPRADLVSVSWPATVQSASPLWRGPGLLQWSAPTELVGLQDSATSSKGLGRRDPLPIRGIIPHPLHLARGSPGPCAWLLACL
jgi:hypothetical protein